MRRVSPALSKRKPGMASGFGHASLGGGDIRLDLYFRSARGKPTRRSRQRWKGSRLDRTIQRRFRRCESRGWFLSDTLTNLTKWRFPRVVMLPDSYLMVFASGTG